MYPTSSPPLWDQGSVSWVEREKVAGKENEDLCKGHSQLPPPVKAEIASPGGGVGKLRPPHRAHQPLCFSPVPPDVCKCLT